MAKRVCAPYGSAFTQAAGIMKRTYRINITRSLDDTYTLLEKSGNGILSWNKQASDRQHHYLEWKQSIWSFSGSAIIAARLKKVQEEETDIIIDIIKPFQFMDPLNILGKVFRKLEAALQHNIRIADKEHST